MKHRDAALHKTNALPAVPSSCHAFLNHLPGMAFQAQLEDNDTLHFNYVSPGSSTVLGISPWELERRPYLLLDSIHPEDRDTFLDSIRRSILDTAPWNWEGRVVLPANAEVKWVNLRATCRKDAVHGTILEGFMVNITHNKQSEHSIKQSHQKLSELSLHIENLKEEERGRIARDIHDDIGVLLTVLRMDLAWLTQRLPNDNAVLREKSRAMAKLLNMAGNTVNALIHTLRPEFLEHFGIVAALEIEAREFSKRTGISTTVIRSADDLALTDGQSTNLFRAFQEILNNIMEPSGARKITIQILKKERCVNLLVSDEGMGFDKASPDTQHALGLRIVQQRISNLGGRATITGDMKQGANIRVCLAFEQDTCQHCPILQQSLF